MLIFQPFAAQDHAGLVKFLQYGPNNSVRFFNGQTCVEELVEF